MVGFAAHHLEIYIYIFWLYVSAGGHTTAGNIPSDLEP
jgi:hypothetical protein